MPRFRKVARHNSPAPRPPHLGSSDQMPGVRDLERFVLEILERQARGEARGALHEAGNELPPSFRPEEWTLVHETHFDDGAYVILACDLSAQQLAVERLTAREREVIRLACAGLANKQIAHEMGIRPATVRVLLWRGSRRLGAAGRGDLIRMYKGLAR